MGTKERLKTVARHVTATQPSIQDPEIAHSSTIALAASPGLHDSSLPTATSVTAPSPSSSSSPKPINAESIEANIPLKRSVNLPMDLAPALFDFLTRCSFNRHQLLKWNGWGYRDSMFIYDPESQQFKFTGDRYLIGNKILPHFRAWCEKNVGVDVNKRVMPAVSDCSQDSSTCYRPGFVTIKRFQFFSQQLINSPRFNLCHNPTSPSNF